MDGHDEYRKIVRESLYKWEKETLRFQNEWILETVKTLAILNSAGLAGSAALYASDSAAKLFLAHYPSAAFFVLGLGAAGWDMYSNAPGFERRQIEIHERIRQLDDGPWRRPKR